MRGFKDAMIEDEEAPVTAEEAGFPSSVGRHRRAGEAAATSCAIELAQLREVGEDGEACKREKRSARKRSRENR